MMGGALGLAVAASLAAARTDTLLEAGETEAVALTGGYHVAFLIGAVFAALGAVLGASLFAPMRPHPLKNRKRRSCPCWSAPSSCLRDNPASRLGIDRAYREPGREAQEDSTRSPSDPRWSSTGSFRSESVVDAPRATHDGRLPCPLRSPGGSLARHQVLSADGKGVLDTSSVSNVCRNRG